MSGWSSSRSMTSSTAASSRSASARSGSYSTSKALEALAADALKLLALGGETKQVEAGDHFIHLQSELGDRRYRRLCEDGDLALAEIHYCQEGLDIGGVRINQESEQVKDLINHDYLVLTLEPGGTGAAAPLHVMAHKLRGGVHVTHVDGSVLHDGVRCFTVQCRKRMRLWALVAILKLEDPDYCLRRSNCWDYAKNTAKRLVKACAEVAGISAAERARLLKEHDNLEANLAFRHMHNVAKSLLRRFSLLKSTPGASRVSSSSSKLSSPVISAPGASRISNSPPSIDPSAMARVWNSSEAPELSSPSARVSSSARPPELFSSVVDTSAASDTLAGVSSSASALPELSSPLISAPAASDLARLQDFQQVAADVAPRDLSAMVNSEPVVNSGTMTESAAFPLASTWKVCLQIVFLMFWLLLHHLGLGPWVASLFGRGFGV